MLTTIRSARESIAVAAIDTNAEVESLQSLHLNQSRTSHDRRGAVAHDRFHFRPRLRWWRRLRPYPRLLRRCRFRRDRSKSHSRRQELQRAREGIACRHCSADRIRPSSRQRTAHQSGRSRPIRLSLMSRGRYCMTKFRQMRQRRDPRTCRLRPCSTRYSRRQVRYTVGDRARCIRLSQRGERTTTAAMNGSGRCLPDKRCGSHSCRRRFRSPAPWSDRSRPRRTRHMPGLDSYWRERNPRDSSKLRGCTRCCRPTRNSGSNRKRSGPVFGRSRHLSPSC